MADTSPSPARPVALHLRFGWMALLFYLSMGLVLEALHGFKVPWYLDVGNETRRLMWTLAHVHGTLLALVNIAMAFTVRHLSGWSEGKQRFASRALIAASLLMPGGFLLGGVYIYGGDPGVGILLVPVGGLLLFVSVLLTGLAVRKHLDLS
ncbi:MAG: hypothetical protein ACE366_00745 [Bradymonadia bacterium]